jgi:hypothetical protein
VLARNWVLAVCLAFALLTAVVPFARSFYRVEVNYNEGWNVYNAAMAAAHQPLYPEKTAWTTINYPMVSFLLMGELHRWTHDYLFTARVVSLLSLCACCLLVAGIVRRLTLDWKPAILAGFFCLAVFSVAADFPAYVGMDDPQMLAQVFYLAGLWVYLGRGRDRLRLAVVALLFVLAVSIKHNPIEFPIAVFLDLLLLARRRALWFCACGAAFLAAALWLQQHFGGPYFLDALLAPRHYSVEKAFEQSGVVLGPLVLPLGVSLWAGYRLRWDPARRVAAILLALSLLFGVFFSGGDGVSINALFGAYLSMSIFVGLSLWHLERTDNRWAAHAPLVLFAWLLIPWLVVPALDERAALSVNWEPPLALERTAAAQSRFDAEVSFLRAQPGPALCESLLRCYFAGKPYIYDPYNATRMIGLGRLDAKVVIGALRKQAYGAVQISGPIESGRRTEMFAPAILAAIEENYQPVLENQDGTIYLPNAVAAAAGRPASPVAPAAGNSAASQISASAAATSQAVWLAGVFGRAAGSKSEKIDCAASGSRLVSLSRARGNCASSRAR